MVDMEKRHKAGCRDAAAFARCLTSNFYEDSKQLTLSCGLVQSAAIGKDGGRFGANIAVEPDLGQLRLI